MKTSYIYTGIIILILSSTSLFSQSAIRPVHWVHGMGSSNAFWNNYRTLFQTQRRIDAAGSTNANYATNAGVINFSNNVRATIPDNSNSIAFGHSMGGVAIREAARFDAVNSTNNFGGIVTAGSPLIGARILNSIASGIAESSILNGVDQLAKGPAATLSGGIFLIVPPGLAGIGSLVIAKKLRILLRNMLTGDPDIPLTQANAETQFGVQTFDNLREGSTYNNDINNSFYGPYKDRIFIFGNENSPIHWRLVSSLVKQNNNVDWDNEDDQDFVKYANNARTAYYAQYLNQVAIANAHFAALNIPAGTYHIWCSNQWKDGSDWLDQSESMWANLIGANTDELLAGTYTTYMQICSPAEIASCELTNSPAYRFDICHVPFDTPYYISVQAGSDGLIPIYSQQAKTSNWAVSNDKMYEASGVNHHEMRGHSNMTNRLRDTFDRLDFFKTDIW